MVLTPKHFEQLAPQPLCLPGLPNATIAPVRVLPLLLISLLCGAFRGLLSLRRTLLPDWLLQELIQGGAISSQWVIWDHEEVPHKGEGQQASGQRRAGLEKGVSRCPILSPLSDDRHPLVRLLSQIPELVIGDNDPIRFFSQLHHEPVIIRRNPLAIHDS